MDFNETKQRYRGTIEATIAFAGQGLEFYTAVKAEFLRDVVARELPGNRRPRLLDVGCGHGYIHPHLLAFGYDIVGVDVATEVIPIARAANPGVVYESYDGEHLPFADGSFDVATAICVMHHVPPPQWPAFVREMRRVLRPGGIAVVFEHNPFNPMTRYVVASNDIDRDAVLLRGSQLRSLLAEAGFTRPLIDYILFTPFAGRHFRALDRALNWCPLGAQYYAVGRVD